MKRIAKIGIIICIVFLLLNMFPMIAYAVITGKQTVPNWWGDMLGIDLGMILLFIIMLMWTERKSLKKELSQIINS